MLLLQYLLPPSDLSKEMQVEGICLHKREDSKDGLAVMVLVMTALEC